MNAIKLITEERQKQIDSGKTIETDRLYNTDRQLSNCAQSLLYDERKDEDQAEIWIELTENELIDWDINLFKKMMRKSYTERLVIAGALICAELDRLNEAL